MPATYVIHTVGPIWRGGPAAGGIGTRREDAVLASCYRESLDLAAQHDLRAVAFPAISTGIYGFPAERAARIAVQTVRAFLDGHDRPETVILVAFGRRALSLYEGLLGACRADG